jgi:hypothetical protein
MVRYPILIKILSSYVLRCMKQVADITPEFCMSLV